MDNNYVAINCSNTLWIQNEKRGILLHRLLKNSLRTTVVVSISNVWFCQNEIIIIQNQLAENGWIIKRLGYILSESI